MMPPVTVLTQALLNRLVSGDISFSELGALTIHQGETADLILHVEELSFEACSSDVRINLSHVLLNTYKVLLQAKEALAKRYAKQGLRCLTGSDDASVVFSLAQHHQRGIPGILPADMTRYVALLKQSIGQGHKPAQLRWAEHQCNGLSTEVGVLIDKDPAAAEALLENMSDYPDAAFALFQLYWPNTVAVSGIQKSAAKAITYLQQAAESEHKDAMLVLSQLCEQGISERGSDDEVHRLIQQDLTQALEWLEKAAKASQSEASYQWGVRLEIGIPGVLQRNKKLALHYFRQAQALGYSKAHDAVERLDPCGFAEEIEQLQQAILQLQAQSSHSEVKRHSSEQHISGDPKESLAVH